MSNQTCIKRAKHNRQKQIFSCFKQFSFPYRIKRLCLSICLVLFYQEKKIEIYLYALLFFLSLSFILITYSYTDFYICEFLVVVRFLLLIYPRNINTRRLLE